MIRFSYLDQTLKLAGNEKAVAAPVGIVPLKVTPLKYDIILDTWVDSAERVWLFTL